MDNNFIGRRFGKLVVVKYLYTNKIGKTIYLCKCDCGNFKEVKRNCLVVGHTKSCGCLPRKGNFKHGQRRTRLYSTWLNIKDRCNNKNNSHFKYYGEKGIKMCDEWANDFLSFKNWAVENGYVEGLSIERIDNNKGYDPNNCKWIPTKEQARNRSNVKFQIINGEKMSLSEIAIKYNVNPSTIYGRYRRGKRNEELINVIGVRRW